MIAKQTQGPALATYGRVILNPLSAKVGVDKGPNPQRAISASSK